MGGEVEADGRGAEASGREARNMAWASSGSTTHEHRADIYIVV